MIFTDGLFVTAADLNIIDGEFSSLAAAEKVVVDSSSSSVLYHSTLSAASDFTARIQNFSGYLVGVGVNSNHMAAVLNILSTAINRPRALMQQITVIEPNPMRSSFARWVRFNCLYDFYRNLYMKRSKEERFAIKMAMYDNEKKRHLKILTGTGFPVVISPLSCPGAIWDYGSGTWGVSNVVALAGGTQPGSVTYDVSITWCSLPGYTSPTLQNGAESGGSTRVTLTVAANHLLQVSLVNLNPPNGIMQNAIGTAPGIYSPMTASHWNVYVGVTGQPMYLQNTIPIPIATTTFNCGGPPVLTGFQQNAGQPAQYDFTMMNVLSRG